MKLRIRGDSIRLRLGRSEVQRFLREGLIEEVTRFPSPRLTALRYCLCAVAGERAVHCVFENDAVTVRIPLNIAHRWATSDEVSVHGSQPIDDGAALKILVEKDFECIDCSPGESQADAFANPRRGVTHGTVA